MKHPIYKPLAICLLLTGCAAGLSPMEKHEYGNIKNKGLLVEDKQP